MTRVQTYLNFAGEAEQAFELYRSVFGGELSSAVRFGDMPIEGLDIPDEDRDKMMHIALPISEHDVLMASDTLPGLGQELVRGNSVHVSLHPESRQEADRLFEALSEGGEVEMPIDDQVWGDYYGACTDRFGIHWMVNCSPEQT